ncbi:MAG: TetR/AcrR family transcriptional regulator [Candidatus Tenebribacter davisii]|jgi:AcrR family transcriptional regulator|nr:TetR/AcrR family transcriptional regulator [Candidatus Tenebribacter davisii]
MSSNNVKQKIIEAAIQCIEAEGLQGATIRKIAQLAEVNVAAINYHFGSKKQLFNIVLNSTLNESFVNNIQDYEDLWISDTKKALQFFLEDTVQGAINYPNLTKAHLMESFIKGDFNTDSVIKINDFLTDLHNLIQKILPFEYEIERKLAIIQLFSSFLMIGMMPNIYQRFLGTEMKNVEIQKKFVEVLIKNYIN